MSVDVNNNFMNSTKEDKVQEALGLKDKYFVWLEISEKDLDAPYRIKGTDIQEIVAIDIKEIRSKLGERLKQQALLYIESHPSLILDNFDCMVFNLNTRSLDFFSLR